MFRLTKLRKEIGFNKEIGGIVNVLQGVASSEFYRLQKERKNLDQFGKYLQTFLQMVDVTGLAHPFIEISQLPQAIVLITSDSGFLGKLNVSIVESAREQFSGNDRLIIVGKQGARLIDEIGENYSRANSDHLAKVTFFPGITDTVDYSEAARLGDFIVKNSLDRKIGKVVVVSPHFVSFSVWKVQVYPLFPCRFLFPEKTNRQKDIEEPTLAEPSAESIIENLISVWVNYMLYGIFWESKLSEWAARVMHLEGSTREIKEVDKKLRFQYFRALHEVSDKDIREIFSSRLVMRRAN